MTIEAALLISVLSLVFSVTFNSISARRNSKADYQKEATAMAMVAAKLETIGEGVAEIRADLKSTNNDVRELRDMGIKHDQSLKAAWRAIDDIREKAGG